MEKRKIGDIVIPKDYPILKGTISGIERDLDGITPLYILENGGRYTEKELQ